MLRRIPATSLVCLSIFLSTIVLNAAWAAGPDESLEILLRPNQASGTPVPAAQKMAARHAKVKDSASQGRVSFMPPAGITKVKPECVPYPMAGPPMCILPTTRQGQWDISVQALFARVKGTIHGRVSSMVGRAGTATPTRWTSMTIFNCRHTRNLWNSRSSTSSDPIGRSGTRSWAMSSVEVVGLNGTARSYSATKFTPQDSL